MFDDISMGWLVIIHAAILAIPVGIAMAELEWEDLHPSL